MNGSPEVTPKLDMGLAGAEPILLEAAPLHTAHPLSSAADPLISLHWLRSHPSISKGSLL